MKIIMNRRFRCVCGTFCFFEVPVAFLKVPAFLNIERLTVISFGQLGFARECRDKSIFATAAMARATSAVDGYAHSAGSLPRW